MPLRKHDDDDLPTKKSVPLNALKDEVFKRSQAVAQSNDKWFKTISLLKVDKELAKISQSMSIVVTGAEDKEDLVVKYNDFYTENIHFRDNDSLSTTGSTESAILRYRNCKVAIVRRSLVLLCGICWGMNLGLFVLYFYLFYIWPMQFSREILDPDATKLIEAKEIADLKGEEASGFSGWAIAGSISILLSTLNSLTVGTWGLVGAYCGRDRILKSFILRGPWLIFTSIVYGLKSVAFTGELSRFKMEQILHRHLGNYYKFNASRKAWDQMQIYLQCCGISSRRDWVLANDDQNVKFPASCCHTLDNKREKPAKTFPYKRENLKRHLTDLGRIDVSHRQHNRIPHKRIETDKTKLEICMTDSTGKMAWDSACDIEIFNFYLLVGAGVAAVEFITILFILSTVFVGYRFYIVNRKLEHKHYHYPGKDYLIDFLFMRTVYKKYKDRQLAKIAPEVPSHPQTPDDVTNTPGGTTPTDASASLSFVTTDQSSTTSKVSFSVPHSTDSQTKA